MKVLYVDVPFVGKFGGDKNRSFFLWKTLREHYQVDTVLIRRADEPLDNPIDYKGGTLFTIRRRRNLNMFSSPSIYSFPRSERKNFRKLVERNDYDRIIFRFASLFELAEVLRPPFKERVIFDVDMLFSRLASQLWESKSSITNRFYLFETLRLKRFDKKFFSQKYQYLFTNEHELDLLLAEFPEYRRYCHIVPNVMPHSKSKKGKKGSPYILFFGSVNSAPNKNAVIFLIRHIYPQIETLLKEKGMKLRIAGRGSEFLSGIEKDRQIEIGGTVDSMIDEINNAEFILLPLFIGSGTNTRILEAAACKQAVVTTTLGIEGLDLSNVSICDTIDEIVNEVEMLIKSPKKRKGMGVELYHETQSKYSERIVGETFCDIVSRTIMPERQRIAFVLNRYYPEVGGAEQNLFFQTTELSKYHDVEVFTPQRLSEDEYVDDFTNVSKVHRLYNLFNPFKKYPDIKSRTICPSLFFKLLFGKFDTIMTFPSLNYNTMLSVIAGKLSGSRIIMCFFDFLDYATLIKNNGGKVPERMLQNHSPRFAEKIFLPAADHIFAISNKEIEYLRQFNKNTSYSPVPVLMDEYSQEVHDPREKYGINPGDFVFLMLGRVSNIKGHDIAVKAFIKANLPKDRAKLVIVGRSDYEPDLIDSIKEQINIHNLNSNIIITGMVDREEAIGWLHTCSVHVIPVRFMNSGAVVVETWAAGRPVIQSSAVDPNYVEPGENGYIFQSEDSDALAKEMIHAYNEADKLGEYGQNGHKLVEEELTYSNLITLYRGIIER